MLRKKKIILGVCGSIAAYKSALLIRLLVREAAEVKVIMTTSAATFITPLTLSTLAKNPVYTDFILDGSGQWVDHVTLGLWADHIIIAPASANTIAKAAHGMCDNLLLAVYLSARCPVSFAPAMDLDMYTHPSVQENLRLLKSYGNNIIEPGTGELASGLSGKGRMAEPEEILSYLQDQFSIDARLKGKKVLITAGPTYEPLDPVRFIGNHSSGKMGYALAEKAVSLGANVTLISGPSALLPPLHVNFVKVNTAKEMYDAARNVFDKTDIAILAAAVADYSPKVREEQKIKKQEQELNLELVKTVDIAAALGKVKRKDQLLVGFALETENETENAKKKLAVKNLDMIVLNSTKDSGAAFGHDTNKVSIIFKNGTLRNFDLKNKKEVAFDIINAILENYA
jgi:phosphopantothenoylcysteine decarboxylase/phosphopantothenate--cysteine ligase